MEWEKKIGSLQIEIFKSIICEIQINMNIYKMFILFLGHLSPHNQGRRPL